MKGDKTLQTNPKIIIKPADKGDNFIIMQRDQYEEICQQILNNRAWYRPIFRTVIDNFCNKYRNIIL